MTEFNEYLGRLRQQTYAIFNAFLDSHQGHEWTPEWLADLAEQIGMWADANYEFVQPQLPAQSKTDCKKGCNYCCNLPVAATVAELALIAREVETWERKDKRALMARNKKALTALARHGDRPRVEAGVACSFLVNGACSIYKHRPLSCRGFNSLDVRDCKAGETSVVKITIEAVQFTIYDTISIALGKFLTLKNKMPATELMTGMALFMGEENPLIAWMKGEQVFEIPRVEEDKEAYEQLKEIREGSIS